MDPITALYQIGINSQNSGNNSTNYLIVAIVNIFTLAGILCAGYYIKKQENRMLGINKYDTNGK